MARFLLIGLDGADPALLERWMGEGHLPNLRCLAEAGAFLPCASVTPPATFPAWTTCVTGVNPGRHGIVDFTEMVPGRYALRFVNRTFRKAPALWNILSAAGLRTAVLGVPGTYPPEAINGLLVSGFDSPVTTRIDPSFVSPPDRFHDVAGWTFADFQESHIGPGWHAQALAKLLDGVDRKAAIAGRLLAQEPWDFFMVVFGESDTVSHHFWLFQDPDSPRHRAGFPDAIRQVYARLDAAVGRLIEAVGEGVVVGVCSDHGFGGAGTGVVHLNNWLAEQGYLAFAGRTGGTSLKRAALRLVPGRWQGVLFRRFTGMAAQAESTARFAGIDWSQTRAYSEELSYFPSVRINLAGREPGGTVAPKDYDATCDALREALEAWPPVARVWRRDEVLHGPYVDRAPDLVLELAQEHGYSHTLLRARGGPAFRRLAPHEHLGGKERGMNGVHRPTGVLLLSEPVHAREARLEDIAPTVLAVLGVPGPPMDGRNLLAQPAGVARPGFAQTETPYTAEESAILEARLRALGYFE